MNELPRPKIISAMPAYNEGAYIGSVVLQARQYADEVIVIDDGSTDHTSRMATLTGARVIRHEKNKGYGTAIQSISIVLGLVAGVLVVQRVFAAQVSQTGMAFVSILLITIGVLCIFTGIILDVLVRRIHGSS